MSGDARHPRPGVGPARTAEDGRGEATAHANRAAAEALIAGLVAAGVRDIVLAPGSRSTPMVLAAHGLAEARPDALRLRVVLDERAAGFLALGLARGSGRPAVAVTTSGSAAAHVHPAIVEADRGGVPLIVASADRPPELRDAGAPQTIDQRGLYGRHVRAAFDLASPDERAPTLAPWTAAALRAVVAATAHGMPGPVHLNIPFRKPFWSASGGPEVGFPPPRSASPPLVGLPTLPRAAVSALARQLLARPRGVIVVGPAPGGRGDGRWLDPAALGELASVLGWPIVAEPGSGLQAHADALGGLAVHHGDAILRRGDAADALEPDVVLRLGSTPTSKAVMAWLAGAAGERQILVDAGGRTHDPAQAAEQLIVADPGVLVRDLADAVLAESAEASRGSRDPAWRARWLEADREAAAALDASLAHTDLWEGAAARAVRDALPDNAALHLASSMPIRDAESFGAPSPAATVFTGRGANGIDGTLATALGEALGTGRPLIAVMGDLTFVHDLSALVPMARAAAEGPAGLALTVVVVDNGGGGIFELLPVHAHAAFEPCFRTPHDGVDPVAVAEALGLPARRATTVGALRDALRDAASPGVRIVQAVVPAAASRDRRARALADAADAAARVVLARRGVGGPR